MRTLFICLTVIFLNSSVFAEMITLKDGRKISGKIVQEDGMQVKIDVKGSVMTYYTDEIMDINGKSLVKSVPVVVKSSETVRTPEAAVTPEKSLDKRALVLKFIDVFGTRKAMTENFNSIINEMAQQKPDEAQKIRDQFKIDEIIERLVPLYEKRFSSDDLKKYIDFYSSEAGKKLTSNIALVMKDSVEVGSLYIQEKFPDLGQ